MYDHTTALVKLYNWKSNPCKELGTKVLNPWQHSCGTSCHGTTGVQNLGQAFPRNERYLLHCLLTHFFAPRLRGLPCTSYCLCFCKVCFRSSDASHVHTYQCATEYDMCPIAHYRAGITSGQTSLVACNELYSWYVEECGGDVCNL